MAATAARIAEVLAGLRSRTACLGAAADLGARRLVPTGLPSIDEPLGGGLPRGRLIELWGPRSSGRMSATLCALATAQRAGELVALVDAADAFDPRSAERAGITLPRLLWVRPDSLEAGLRACDLVLDAGGFGLVALYLCGVRARLRCKGETRPPIADGALLRLAHRAERAKSAVLVLTDRPLAGTFAAATLESQAERPAWVGGGASPRLLEGLVCHLVLRRSKMGAPASAGAAPEQFRVAVGTGAR